MVALYDDRARMSGPMPTSAGIRLAIDTGGTFTDVVVQRDDGLLTLHKAPTTPHDPIEGILEAIRRAASADGLSMGDLLRRTTTVIHGTTRATNAILTDTAARTAFLSTAGHPDVLVFRMGGRELPFEHAREYPDPYVPRSLTFEIPERMDYRGEVVRALDISAVHAVIDALIALGIEAVGVCLLWSVSNPAHELAVGDALRERAPEIAVTLSHQLNPVVREYHRASAACIDASLKPLMAAYLADLEARLGDAGFDGRLLVSSAAGGLMKPQWLADAPIHSINSGPAMAPVAGRHHAEREADSRMAIVIDAGGTSFDVSVVRSGRIPRTRETWLGDRFVSHITGFPSVDVRTSGSGGGSIAAVDPGGLLTVGPESAGSVPGPVCYGTGGTRVTVTDAGVILGYLDPSRLDVLGVRTDVEAARRAISEQIGAPLRLSTEAAAEAVIRVVTEQMVHAVEEVTVQQGVDPRSAVLVSGGGAAGFNVVAIAARLGCRKVIIPQTTAGLSATGGLLSDVVAEAAVALYTTSTNFEQSRVNDALGSIIAACLDQLENAGIGRSEATIELVAEARYPGQVWELEVALRANAFRSAEDLEQLIEDFHSVHEEVFAVRDTGSSLEIVGWRALGSTRVEEDQSLTLDPGSELDLESTREIYVAGGGWCEVPVLGSARITEVRGPAVLELPGTSIVLNTDALATRSPHGSIVITTAIPSDLIASDAREFHAA
jgi:N-methylhydantoinase A